VRTLDGIDEHGMCCSDLMSVDSITLVFISFDYCHCYLVYYFVYSKSKIFWNYVRI
jgi:hypothetical protein